MKKGFTLVELVIVIVIVGILSMVAVPIYKQYVEKAKLTEGMAALSAIKIAQDIYFAQHEGYYTVAQTQYDNVLGIDLRGNKYFDSFRTVGDSVTNYGYATVVKDDGASVTLDFASPGNEYSNTLNGITKTTPYLYYEDKDGKKTFI